MKNPKGMVVVTACFRCPPEMKKKLEDRAIANGRHLRQEVMVIVRRALYPKKKKSEDRFEAIEK